MKILTIETTCDETAAAVVTDQLEVLASVVASQEDLHRRYGGVVPELASRAHVERILPVIHETLQRAGVRGEELDAVAVATTPGLAGSLLVGLAAAKALALAWRIPLVGGESSAGPHLCLPHGGRQRGFSLRRIDCQRRTFKPLRLPDGAGVRAFGRHDRRRGRRSVRQGRQSVGPRFSGRTGHRAARRSEGDPAAFDLPRPLLKDTTTLDFSFSGLKTAVRYRVAPPGEPLPDPASWPRQKVADLAAAFQDCGGRLPGRQSDVGARSHRPDDALHRRRRGGQHAATRAARPGGQRSDKCGSSFRRCGCAPTMR